MTHRPLIIAALYNVPLLLLGTVFALTQSHAEQPIPRELVRALDHCAQQREIVHDAMLIFGQARNEFAASKQFEAYLKKHVVTTHDAISVDDAMAWLDKNALRVDAALARVQRDGKGSAALAEDVANTLAEECRTAAIKQVVANESIEKARQVDLADAMKRCPDLENIKSMSEAQLRRNCPR